MAWYTVKPSVQARAQRTSAECWLACLEMLFTWKGKDETRICDVIDQKTSLDSDFWFDGEPTEQSGTDRTFVSPALAPGRECVYRIRVRWDDNGKPVERKRDVTVHAGDRITLTIDR